MDQSIGRIEHVPLRKIWRHEALNFTTWLRDNIDVLNQVLDFTLSNPENEQSTGNFSVDLVAEDDEGNIVVIENQLGKSDHDHLGKIVTYLAAIDAKKAIWIVSEPRQEHIKAISWLNEATHANFYLLKIEGIKINNSAPAPLFTVIVGPSEEAKKAGEAKKEYTERHHLRKDFWQQLLDKAKVKTKLHENISPGIYSWIGAGAGISGISYNYVVGQHDSKVEIYIDKDHEAGEENKRIFDELYRNKEAIEKNFGDALTWERLDNKRAARVTKKLNKGGYRDKENWGDITDTMIDAMIRFEKAISPFLKKFRNR